MLFGVAIVRAQAGSDWSPPQSFFQVSSGGDVQSPVLLTDSGGNVHALWGASMDERQSMALYYSQWKGDNWTKPVDVLVSPDGDDIWPFSAYIVQDTVHVYWISNGQVAHSEAHASQLANPHQWSAPSMITTENVPFAFRGFFLDESSTWYLVYGNRALDKVSILTSVDGGVTWNTEQVVYQELSASTWIGSPSVTVAPDKTVWVSWEEMDPRSGRGKGVTYARSLDGGLTWSAPEKLIDGYYFGGFKTVGDIFLKLYAGGIGTGGRYVSFSTDSGLTWTEVRNISAGNGEGAQGIGLVVDSAGVWQFIVESNMTFARVAWDGTTWFAPDFVLSYDAMYACCVSSGGVTENASVAISDGNRIHVIFEQDDLTLWHTSRLLDAPEVPSVRLSQPSHEPATVAIEQGDPDAVIAVGTPIQQRLDEGFDRFADVREVSSWLSVVVALVSVCVFVGLVVIAKQLRRYP